MIKTPLEIALEGKRNPQCNEENKICNIKKCRNRSDEK